MDLQAIAENSIDQMVTKVASQRRLPDDDWARTLERRTSRALLGTNETEVRAELLLSAFKDAPFLLPENKPLRLQDLRELHQTPKIYFAIYMHKVYLNGNQ